MYNSFFVPSFTVGKHINGAPKCERRMVLSNDLFFQYYNSNIGLFSIAPCKVIALNLLLSLFLALKGNTFSFTLAFTFKNKKRATTNAIAKRLRATTFAIANWKSDN